MYSMHKSKLRTSIATGGPLEVLQYNDADDVYGKEAES